MNYNKTNETERVILGRLIQFPAELESCDLTASDFSAGRERETFQGIAQIWEESRPPEIPLPVLAGEIHCDDPSTYVASLLNGNIPKTTATLAYLARTLRKWRVIERVFNIARRDAEEALKTGDIDLFKSQELLAAYAEFEGLGGKAGFDINKALMTGTQIQALDIQVEWSVNLLVPERSITVLHGPGGLGKTWLCHNVTKAVSEGKPFLGLPTKRSPVVYIDYENPWPVHKERVCKINLGDNYRAWHLSFEPRPPKLDSADWEQFKLLPPKSLIIFDSCRASHSGKGNDDDVAALVMGRLKEIREKDQTIIVLHHTPRANDKQSKGSTAWTDLADQTLALYRLKHGTYEEIEEEGYDPNALLFFGTGDKSRYERTRLCVTFNPKTGEFTRAEDPGLKALEMLAEYIAGEGHGKNQTTIIDWAKKARVANPVNDKIVRTLLSRGENEGRWYTEPGLLKNAKLYYAGPRQ